MLGTGGGGFAEYKPESTGSCRPQKAAGENQTATAAPLPERKGYKYLPGGLRACGNDWLQKVSRFLWVSTAELFAFR